MIYFAIGDVAKVVDNEAGLISRHVVVETLVHFFACCFTALGDLRVDTNND